MEEEDQPPTDPLYDQDPWGGTTIAGVGCGPQRRVYSAPTTPRGSRSQTHAWDNWGNTGRGGHQPTPPGSQTQRVAGDDELSDSEPNAVPTQLPGYTTPQAAMPMSYLGVPASTPYYQRTGPAQLSEHQLSNLLFSQRVTSSARPTPPPLSRPHLIRHNLPMSTASSASSRVTGEVTRATIQQYRAPLDRVTQSIDAVRALRAQ